MQITDCWNTIGTWGSATPRCERLAQVGHCSNCEVYRSAGRQLLDRAAPEGYLKEWGDFLSNATTRVGSHAMFYLFFQLADRVLGLRSALLEQVTDAATIRRLPHQRNPTILGLTHIRGDVLPCISFSVLLNDSPPMPTEVARHLRRFIVCRHEHRRWVLPVDEVLGLQRVDRADIQSIPIMDVLNPQHAISAGLYSWRGKIATILESDRLVASLKQVST